MPTNNPQQGGDSDLRSDQPTQQREAGPTTRVVDCVSQQSFSTWYDERQVEQNILDGQAYFNGPSPPKDPDQHSPSKLLQCHRKAMYSRQNAPREGQTPEGLFWVGSAFEEDIIVPYLQDIIPDEVYVQNSLWVDTTVSRNGTEVRIRGSTDPAIVTEDYDPVFLTEIKTTSSLEHLHSPKEHHKAQLHAYLYALAESNDNDIKEIDGLLVYGSRKTLDIRTFHIQFDPEFWERVVEWMISQTEYEQDGELPPATPERDWECNYCSFKHRCGQADTPYQDTGNDGLLPMFDGYDRENLTEYLDAHADAGAKVTPTLAHVFPDLADTYGTYDWSCPRCAETFAWDAVDWDGDTSTPPFCPDCLEADELIALSGPDPTEQLC